MPDLVAINGQSKSALVLEVVICNSTDIINSRYTDKLVKYDTVEARSLREGGETGILMWPEAFSCYLQKCVKQGR